MSGGLGTATAVSFVWLGMVLAISFLEAPLKFRAPGVDLRLGLGIGRLVFRALNAVEAVLAVTILVAVIAGEVPDRVLVAAGCAVTVLLVQLVGIRPLLTKRSDRVLAGEDPGRSRLHLLYVVAEVLKVAALVSAGVLALNAA